MGVYSRLVHIYFLFAYALMILSHYIIDISNFLAEFWEEDHGEEFVQSRRQQNRERRTPARSQLSHTKAINLRNWIPQKKELKTLKAWTEKEYQMTSACDSELSIRKVKIAVIDTGIDFGHSLFKNQISTNPGETGLDSLGRNKASNGIDDDGNGFIDDYHGWDFTSNSNLPIDQEGHGTHIAGILLSGGSGKAYNSWFEILPIKFYDSRLSADENIQNTVNAIHYAIDQGADIINYSAGGNSQSPKELSALKRAEENGVLVVAAAGNEGRNSDYMPYYPASYKLSNIISVGSLAPHKKISSTSNYGQESVDLFAPGENILSSHLNNSYKILSGTSQATAYVGHLAACLISKGGPKSPRGIIKLLTQNGLPAPQFTKKSKYGVAINPENTLKSRNLANQKREVQVSELPM